jgi:hypothetical protein
MKNIELIKQLVENTELPTLQKNNIRGFLERSNEADEKKKQDIDLIEQIDKRGRLLEIYLSNEEVKIYTTIGRTDLEKQFPFSILLYKDNKWHRLSRVSSSFDIAFLIYLENKYLGDGYGFSHFAAKMLEIKH